MVLRNALEKDTANEQVLAVQSCGSLRIDYIIGFFCLFLGLVIGGKLDIHHTGPAVDIVVVVCS